MQASRCDMNSEMGTRQLRMNRSSGWRGAWLFVLTALVSFLLTGCHTTNNPAAAEASADATAAVQIRGNTPGQISQVATEVFENHGYTRPSKQSGALVFEKPGSKLSNLAYGNWMGDSPIWIRVKLSIVPTGEQQYSLLCTAYHIRDRGSSTEEQMKVNRVSSGPYQKILDEIAKRFRTQPATVPG